LKAIAVLEAVRSKNSKALLFPLGDPDFRIADLEF